MQKTGPYTQHTRSFSLSLSPHLLSSIIYNAPLLVFLIFTYPTHTHNVTTLSLKRKPAKKYFLFFVTNFVIFFCEEREKDEEIYFRFKESVTKQEEPELN